ncbi:EXS family-domain-containing protein [Lanmaoa asiatica]|nr:EXS family-domain-containing protein [Lanmaoa asiatica]
MLGCRGSVDTSKLGTQTSKHSRRSGDHSRSQKKEGIAKETEKDPDSSNTATSSRAPDDSTRSPPKRSNSIPRLLFGGTRHPLDPQEYQHAKRRLRKAVIEHYRCVEMSFLWKLAVAKAGLARNAGVLSSVECLGWEHDANMRHILNLTGFRKALKKYEKITNNSVLDAYMKEKVEPSAFASGAMVSTMLKEMEDLFTMRFERGDRKKAMDRLRVGPSSKTHHFSTFRSGLWLGLALPAVAGGSYLSFQEHTRNSLASWNILLYIYSIFLVPALLALLIGINIAVWARERINYVFIFELNPRSRIDHHEYFELPSFLLCTLAHAFWFSLAQIGPPMLWPVIWLAVVLVVMFNPIRSFMWGRARWWTIKNIAKLGASGVWRVEFTDFWLGDQFCSLIYSLSHLYFVGCFYTHFVVKSPTSSVLASAYTESPLYASFTANVTSPHRTESSVVKRAFKNLLSSAYDPRTQDAWSTCGAARNWGWYYFFGVLPFAVRFVQSLRRYRDSTLPTHLINAGKYGMGMIYYFFYYYWRHQEGPHIGASYTIWCFTAIAYAIYGCTWVCSCTFVCFDDHNIFVSKDSLMDWSMCKPHARYPLLRTELVYKSQIPVRFLVSNICIRFIWLTYIPLDGPNYTLRTFIAAMLEMLRRVQWNFYRLENEHLGNMDQYRVTREVPLPYTFDVQSNEEEDENEEEAREAPSWLKKRTAHLKRNGGHG